MPAYPTLDGFFLFADPLRITPDTSFQIYKGGPASMVFPPHTLALLFPDFETVQEPCLAFRLVGSDLMIRPSRSLDLLKPSIRVQYDILHLELRPDGCVEVYLRERHMRKMQILMTNVFRRLMKTHEGDFFVPLNSTPEGHEITDELPYIAIVAPTGLGYETAEINGRTIRIKTQELAFLPLTTLEQKATSGGSILEATSAGFLVDARIECKEI